MTKTEIAYLAGIIDGEGCISFGVRLKKYVTPTLQIVNTDSRLTDWLKTNLGGNVYARPEYGRPSRKPTLGWSIAGAKAREIIRTVRPFLKIKDRQADVVLIFGRVQEKAHRRRKKNGQMLPLPKSHHEATAIALAQIRALNRRGVSP